MTVGHGKPLTDRRGLFCGFLVKVLRHHTRCDALSGSGVAYGTTAGARTACIFRHVAFYGSPLSSAKAHR